MSGPEQQTPMIGPHAAERSLPLSHRHKEILTDEQFAIMQEAAGNIGGVALNVVGKAGEDYFVPSRRRPYGAANVLAGKVPEGSSYVEIGSAGDTGNFYAEVDRLKAQKAA